MFTDVPIHHTSAKESHEWLSGPDIKYWPQALNFSVWCSTSGCGVSIDLLDNPIFMFHFHFTMRRILYELNYSLPGDKTFDPKGCNYNKVAFSKLKNEFGLKQNCDFRYLHGYNQGLGHVWGYWGIGGHELTDKEVHAMPLVWDTGYHTETTDTSTFFEPNKKKTSSVRNGPGLV